MQQKRMKKKITNVSNLQTQQSQLMKKSFLHQNNTYELREKIVC